MSSSLVGHSSRVQTRHRTAISRRRRLSLPLSLRDYSNLPALSGIPELLARYPKTEDNKAERGPKITFTFPLTRTLFGSLLGIIFLRLILNPYFDAGKACIAIIFSLLSLPLVRPLRWLTRGLFRLSLWASLYLFTFTVHSLIVTSQTISSFANGARNTSRRGIGLDRGLLADVVVGLIACYIVVAGVPFLQIATFSTEITLFVFRLLKAFLMLQYYMILLTGLEVMIYLRIDYLLSVLGSAWFRWAVQRVWSVLTWADIVLAMFPSAYYYIHLALYDK